jgi:hypothetical protein|tara:strand:+ start:2397 stop:2720 length:324 start_codon:yes stop_codon:yes gene_type:complete
MIIAKLKDGRHITISNTNFDKVRRNGGGFEICFILDKKGKLWRFTTKEFEYGSLGKNSILGGNPFKLSDIEEWKDIGMAEEFVRLNADKILRLIKTQTINIKNAKTK